MSTAATTKNKSRGPSLPKEASPKGMCARSVPWRWLPPSSITRRTWRIPFVSAFARAVAWPHGDPAAPLPDDLPLPHRSGIRLDACADSDLVPLLHSRLHQWPGMGEPPHGPRRTSLLPPGELFPLGRGHSASATAFSGTTPGELERTTPAVRPATE